MAEDHETDGVIIRAFSLEGSTRQEVGNDG
jgi:hypothetical protein